MLEPAPEAPSSAPVEAKVRFSAPLDPDFPGKVTVSKSVNGVVTPVINFVAAIMFELEMIISILEDLKDSACTIKIEGVQSVSGDTLAQAVQVAILSLSLCLSLCVSLCVSLCFSLSLSVSLCLSLCTCMYIHIYSSISDKQMRKKHKIANQPKQN